MAETGFLPKEKIEGFLGAISKDALLYTPVLEGDIVIFRPFNTGNALCLDRPANSPPKSVIYPQSDVLFSYEYKKETDDPKKVSVEIETHMDYPKSVIFGCRPCDAIGFTVYDRVFIESNGPDTYYQGRRDKTTIITLSCPAPSAGCFCTALGSGPANKEGSDVLMTILEKGFFLEPVSEKGKAILGMPEIEDGSQFIEEARKKQQQVHDAVKKPFPSISYTEISRKRFDLDEFWQQAVSKCVSCGACTFLCPTCYCFNFTDEQTLEKGERIRSWDACMFYHFTLEASGHNPRATRFLRYRNRVGHKFLFYPEKYNGVIACSGCGRCIRYCPVSVDISEIVSQLRSPE
jgi:sulfhydrogenase subunit beta (sulfur reductase)